jgi:hypothetical protein
MKLFHIYSILIIFISISQLLSSNIDLSFSKKEPIELEDKCLKRAYHKTGEPFYFFPVLSAKLKEVGDKYSFPSRCFGKNIVFFKESSKDKITFTLQNFNKTETFCSELFIFHTSNHNFFQFVAFQGEHEITIKRITQDDKDEIKINGVKLYKFCSGFINTIKSLFRSVKAFYGGMGLDPKAKNPKFRPTIPRDMEKANLRILELFNYYTPERRNNTIVNIDKNKIKSGDVIVISRMDGIDPMIMVGSGGHIGHCCVCTWMDDDLYVIEAQDALYWPRNGIQRNKWDDWIQWAHNADFNVALLPLREEYRQKMDFEKANAWFENEVEGLNYGFHNFLFAWADTLDRNAPVFLTHESIELVMSLLSKIYPKFSDLLVTEALNMRLGTKNLTIQQAIAEAARRGKSFEQLMAEPEIEGYEYSDGLNYVCSCFVIAYFEHGGLFGDMEILPNEFTPRDVYILDIYDKNYERPQECIDDNPELPYCQIMGKFVLKLDNYSTIAPYSHMNERCPSEGPDFIRDEGC